VTPAQPLQAGPSIRVRAAGLLAGITLALVPWLLLVLHSSGSPGTSTAPRPLPAEVSAAGLVERSGVRVVRVAATGGGGLLDLRYEVVDPDTAAAIHGQGTPPALVDERTGLVIGQLLMGHMHHGRVNPGQSYYLVFMNPGDAVRRGGRVSVVLGDARLMHVMVR
jgi:hypothetical protein